MATNLVFDFPILLKQPTNEQVLKVIKAENPDLNLQTYDFKIEDWNPEDKTFLLTSRNNSFHPIVFKYQAKNLELNTTLVLDDYYDYELQEPTENQVLKAIKNKNPGKLSAYDFKIEDWNPEDKTFWLRPRNHFLQPIAFKYQAKSLELSTFLVFQNEWKLLQKTSFIAAIEKKNLGLKLSISEFNIKDWNQETNKVELSSNNDSFKPVIFDYKVEKFLKKDLVFQNEGDILRQSKILEAIKVQNPDIKFEDNFFSFVISV